MKAMILAAGRGERLRPLTDTAPKPLLTVAGKTLIEYHLLNLASAGFKDIIINTAWLAGKVHQKLGDGSKYKLNIQYSDEGQALETAGGIIHALPQLGSEPFLVINGDIYCEYDFSRAKKIAAQLTDHIQAHLVLVNNPVHNQTGDFALHHGRIKNTGDNMHTYSGIGIYTPAFFANQQSGTLPLAPIIREKCAQDRVSGEVYNGTWTDVGTLERLQQLETQLNNA